MAIKMTMYNNDYTEIMEEFLKEFHYLMRKLPEREKRTLEMLDDKERIDRLLNPNVTKSWTEEDKGFLSVQIRNTFLMFLKSTKYEHLDLNIDYILDKLEISFVDTVGDKWENGESCYWFFYSGGTVITL